MVRPYVTKFGVTYVVAVDTADVLGRAFGLKAIPAAFYVDETGLIRLRGGSPSADFLSKIEQLLKEPSTPSRAGLAPSAAAPSRAELEKRVTGAPTDWKSRVALARMLSDEGKSAAALEQVAAAARLRAGEPETLFVWGLVLLRLNQKEAALEKLKQARDLDPENWRIRKQIWAIEHPEKFYTGDSPDFGWQKEELARERHQK